MVRILNLFKKSLAVAMVSATLAACGTTTGGGTSNPPVATETDALWKATLAFQGALVLVNAAVDSGKLKGEDAKKASDILAKIKVALDAGRAVEADSLITQLKGML